MLPFLQKAFWASLAHLMLLTLLPLAGRAATVAHATSSALVGLVRNKANHPLPGVVVTLQGMPATTTTNAAGEFLLSCEETTPVLVFKCAGYQTQALLVKAKGPLGITLYEVGTPILPPPAGLEIVGQPVEIADEEPMFPGGVTGYHSYLKKNFHYPEAAAAKGVSGTVLVGFAVDEKGRILDAEVAKGVEGLNEEALRLVRLMPWWTPARRGGQPVRVNSSLRIRFELRQE